MKKLNMNLSSENVQLLRKTRIFLNEKKSINEFSVLLPTLQSSQKLHSIQQPSTTTINKVTKSTFPELSQ